MNLKSLRSQSGPAKFSENFGFKLIALFISLILWLTILGRRDFVISKNVEIEILTDPNYVVASQTQNELKLRLSGPRSALRLLQESQDLKSITIPLKESREGFLEVEVPLNTIRLPNGVKIISARPQFLRVEVIRAGSGTKGSRNTRGNQHH